MTAPVRPASTPDLATAWMAVVKSGVSPRQATLEAPMLPAHCGKRRRPTSRTSPAAPSSEAGRWSASLTSGRPLPDAWSLYFSSPRSCRRRSNGSLLGTDDGGDPDRLGKGLAG